MSPHTPVLTLSVVVALSLCAMLATSEVLSALATPSEVRPAAALPPAALPVAGPVCHHPAAVAATELRRGLSDLFARSGAAAEGLDVSPDPAASRYPATVPIRFRTSARMSPAVFLDLIHRIRTERPDILLTQVDLAPRAADVHVVLAGEIVCWAAV
jgi:hypothetical protein